MTSSPPDSPVKASSGAGNLVAVKDRLRSIGCVGLSCCADRLRVLHLDVSPLACVWVKNQVAFQPIYRLRQSLAVANSPQHDPRPREYHADKSVVNVLDENGFAIFDGEPGPRLTISGWDALLTDGPQLDRIINEAKNVTIDTTLPPEIIQANELGLADFIYFSFRLFGDKISSLYYFYYLVVAVTCLMYILQFRNSPFPLFLLVSFLGELYFLENYANSYGAQLQAVTNSRLFSRLALVPALHVLLVLWQRLPPRALTVASVSLQSLIFAFLLSCRTEAAWQIAMVVAVACGIGMQLLLPLRGQKMRNLMNHLSPLWPAVILVVVSASYSTIVSIKADRRYSSEPKGHIIWHEILMGILSTSPELRREYVGSRETYLDQEVYNAVMRDLNARNDASSPIVRTLGNGELIIDLMAGWNEYEKLARSLALRIILHHPLVLVETLPTKVEDQLHWYNNPVRHTMAWANLRMPVIIIALGALICMAAGGFTIGLATLRSAAIIVAVLSLFASVTPWIETSFASDRLAFLLSRRNRHCVFRHVVVLLIRDSSVSRLRPEGVSRWTPNLLQ